MSPGLRSSVCDILVLTAVIVETILVHVAEGVRRTGILDTCLVTKT